MSFVFNFEKEEELQKEFVSLLRHIGVSEYTTDISSVFEKDEERDELKYFKIFFNVDQELMVSNKINFITIRKLIKDKFNPKYLHLDIEDDYVDCECEYKLEIKL